MLCKVWPWQLSLYIFLIYHVTWIFFYNIIKLIDKLLNKNSPLTYRIVRILEINAIVEIFMGGFIVAGTATANRILLRVALWLHVLLPRPVGLGISDGQWTIGLKVGRIVGSFHIWLSRKAARKNRYDYNY